LNQPWIKGIKGLKLIKRLKYRRENDFFTAFHA